MAFFVGPELIFALLIFPCIPLLHAMPHHGAIWPREVFRDTLFMNHGRCLHSR